MEVVLSASSVLRPCSIGKRRKSLLRKQFLISQLLKPRRSYDHFGMDYGQILGIRITKTCTTPLHPQSDRRVERFNRTLEDYLSFSSKEMIYTEVMFIYFWIWRPDIHEAARKNLQHSAERMN